MAPPEAQIRRKSFVDELYRLHSAALERFLARRRFSREEAADIVQEAFIRMHQLPDVESIEFPKALLFRIATNLARDMEKHRRIASGQGVVDADQVEIDGELPGPYRVLKGEQELALARAALRELGPKCRQVFIMHRFESASYGQIARALDISVSMVEKYVSQALAHVRLRLKREGAAGGSARRLEKS